MTVILFVLNPGSTSTKTALFRDAECLFEQTIHHKPEEILAAASLIEQMPIRQAAIESALQQALSKNHLLAKDITAFVGRGGLIRSLPSGVYPVNADMLADLRIARYGEHASNLGAVIAYDLASRYGKNAYIADPPSVDEMIDIARITGIPMIRRKSAFHALNHKAIAHLAAAQIGRPYESCNLIVAHLGGGISIGAHRNGQVIDVNNALEEGPLSPERAGSLPTLQLIDWCFSGQISKDEMYRRLVGQGGIYAYAGTNDYREIEEQAKNSPGFQDLLAAMNYQIAKSIGAMAVSLAGRIDAIVLTGGLAHSSWLTRQIQEQVTFLGPVLIYPGENEMVALASKVGRVLNKNEMIREYIREP